MWKDIKCLCISWRIESSTDYSQFGYSHFIETRRNKQNLTQIFKTAVQEKAIVLLDEFDSLGKIRDYDQDHGEMKRVVNTILQLFDFVSQDTIIIAATNQLQ